MNTEYKCKCGNTTSPFESCPNCEKPEPMNTKQLTYPSIESQKQFWINKEAKENNATHETREADWTCPTCGHDIGSACPQNEQSTTADPKPKDIGGNELPDRIEANSDYYSLRDEGRNPNGDGESYSERNR